MTKILILHYMTDYWFECLVLGCC